MQSISVSELVSRIKVVLEFNPSLKDICVSGEVSNLRNSKYLFFSLKDDFCKINCVCFDSSLKVENNSLVKAFGYLSFNKKSGGVSFIINKVERVSKSLIYERFLKTKEKLEKKGYFEGKKSLPLYPEKIGVVASRESDALKDVLSVLSRRFPCADVFLKHTSVQGFGSVRSICNALSFLDEKVDIILIVRGGGSYEDLDVFNSEELARVIFGVKTPVVSGVGHESDFTICDFVCDVRAATPSAAAEVCSPKKIVLLSEINSLVSAAKYFLRKDIDSKINFLDMNNRICKESLRGEFNNKIGEIDIIFESLKVYDKNFVLSKGYSISLKDGKVLKSAKKGDEVLIVTHKKDFRSVIV
ncbi:MAG: exodeoxyribonuclease VII large subunit [Candidatus Woesearchaeota archaeon]